ncbi:hypothetical protein Adeh_3249 [Anaeromyxobacter dehalogenans 2CP-C]|uniref:DUF2381 family protein n=1 Tax=Anaeromyxobacter dehalogenans (strain 2CP-C) TaxID=290397 RepID=Q2IEK8_ANADE|nr:hypothetical protein Adeh_3249 [Anaeromyxobacter dehalogenans 2CP-C]
MTRGSPALAACVAVALAAAGPAHAGDKRELRRRAITIDDAALTSVPEIRVAGGTPTILTFEVPVKDGGAVLADVRGVFYAPTQTDRTVMLVPKTDLARPEPLNVSLADGTVLTFKLVTVPGEADVQVDVAVALRERASPDSAQALRMMNEQLRGELDECRDGAANAGAAKLAALLLAQSLDQPQTFERRPLHIGDKQSRLLVQGRWVYRLLGLTYMVFTVENRDPQRSWVLDRVEVRLTGGRDAVDVKVVSAQAELPILPPGTAERVVVAYETPPMSPSQRFRVTFHEKDGPRLVALEGASP